MRQLIIVALSSLVIAGQASAQTQGSDNPALSGMTMTADSMAQNFQNHMFDGIELTEQQRQQMRDLMFQTRQMQTASLLSDIETQHQLVTSPEFNEGAVRIQAEKMAQIRVNEQVEMARVRHQMFNLLTPRQQAVLQKNFQLRMSSMRSTSELP